MTVELYTQDSIFNAGLTSVQAITQLIDPVVDTDLATKYYVDQCIDILQTDPRFSTKLVPLTAVPIATRRVLGGIIVGNGLTISLSGILETLPTFCLPLVGGEISGSVNVIGNVSAANLFGTLATPATATETVLGNIRVGKGLAMNADGALYTLSTSCLPLSGGTVTGNVTVQGALALNTVSSTTYYNLPSASISTFGCITVGKGLSIDTNGSLYVLSTSCLPLSGGNVSGNVNIAGALSATTFNTTTYSNLPSASTVTFGVIRVGKGLSLDTNGSLYVLSTSCLPLSGGDVVGNVNIAGTLSATTFKTTTYFNLPSASSNTFGVIQVGKGLSIDIDGSLYVLSTSCLPLSGGNVTGNVNVAGTLSATTFKSTTYFNLPSASTTTFGGVRVGSGLYIDESNNLNSHGLTAVPIATSSLLGGIIVGDGLRVDGTGVVTTKSLQLTGGVIEGDIVVHGNVTATNLVGHTDYTLAKASAGVLGGVRIGDNLSIDVNGVLSTSAYNLPVASTSVLGGVKIGSNLSIDGNGLLKANDLVTASSSVLGGVKVGTNLTIDGNGVLSSGMYNLNHASSSVLGGIRVGANLSIDGSGVLSTSAYTLPTATTGDIGGVKIGRSLVINNGVTDVRIGNSLMLNSSGGVEINPVMFQELDDIVDLNRYSNLFFPLTGGRINGNLVVTGTISASQISSGASPLYLSTNKLIGAGGSTYTLTNYSDNNSDNYVVTLDGVTQTPGINFTINVPYITFNQAVATGVAILAYAVRAGGNNSSNNGGGSAYTLPIASTSTLGGFRVGSGLLIDQNGILSVVDDDSMYGGGSGGGLPVYNGFDNTKLPLSGGEMTGTITGHGAGLVLTSSTLSSLSLFAGSPSNKYGWLEGQGIDASFNRPQQSVMDSNGNIFVADSFNHKIRKITPNGTVTTFAGLSSTTYITNTGQGRAGFTDGTLDVALFAEPVGIVIDSKGNFFVSTPRYHTIRKITKSVVSGNIVYTTSIFAGVHSLTVGGHLDGPGVTARFFDIQKLAIDSSDNIYVIDSTTSYTYIRKITPSGVVSTFAGTTVSNTANNTANKNSTQASTLYLYGADPYISGRAQRGISVDSQDNIIYGDWGRILKITQAGVVTTLVGGIVALGRRLPVDGTGSVITFAPITSLKLAPDGTIYTGHQNNVRKTTFNSSGVPTTVTIAGYGDAIIPKTKLGAITSFEFARNTVYMIDFTYSKISVINGVETSIFPDTGISTNVIHAGLLYGDGSNIEGLLPLEGGDLTGDLTGTLASFTTFTLDTSTATLSTNPDTQLSDMWITGNYYGDGSLLTGVLPLTGGTITGNLAVTGTLAVTGNTTVQGTLSTTGNTTIHGNAIVHGDVIANGDVVAFNTSDRALKNNITNIPFSLDKVTKLNGVSFDWNSELCQFSGRDIGVIAQDVEQVLPEIVITRDNGYKAVQYDKLVAVLIEAVKELKQEVDELKKSKH